MAKSQTLREPDAAESFRRSLKIERAVVDDKRRMDISVSSETPVERYFGDEILVHTPEAVDLEFLTSGSAPLLMDHNDRDQIGVIERAWVDTESKKVRATVRFSQSERGQEIQRDVEDGIRGNVSISYRINRMERNEETGEVRVLDWYPFEVSIVSVPADTSVGVGRSHHGKVKEMTEKTKSAEAINMEEIRKEALEVARREFEAEQQEQRNSEAEKQKREAERQKERERIASDTKEMLRLGAKYNCADKAEEAIKAGRSLSEFKGFIVDSFDTEQKPLVDERIGLTDKETRGFSVFKLVRAMESPEKATEIAGFELEATRAAQEAKEAAGGKVQGYTLPDEIMRNWITPEMARSMWGTPNARMGHNGGPSMMRDLNTTDDSALIPTDHLGLRFIDVLRNSMSVMQAGATMLPGLSGNVDIPRKATASTFAWLASEGANTAESEPTFDTVSLSPKDGGMYLDITRRMTQQSNPAIEGLSRMDLAQGVALGIDLGALSGSGSSGQPRGVKNTSGINAPTSFAAANPTFAEVVAMETAVAEDNALMGNLSYIGTPSMYGALKTTVKDAGSGQFVVEPGGTVNGYTYIRSNQVTSGDLYFANWSELLIGMWGTLDLDRDTAAGFLAGTIRLRAIQTVDVAVRHPVSFALNNDGV